MKHSNIHVVIAWGSAVFASLLGMGILGNFHPSLGGFFVFSVLLQGITGWLLIPLIEKGDRLRFSQPLELLLFLSILMGLLLFAWKMFAMLSEFPQLFDARYVLLEDGQLIPFLLAGILSLPLLWAWQRRYADFFHGSGLWIFLQQYGVGLLLASIFFAIYLPIAVTFNQPAYDVDDIFFDTDGLLWRTRFTTDMVEDYYQRSVHPFVLLVIRPLVTLISVILRGDRLAAAYVLTAMAGALCVFLTWVFVKEKTGNSLHASLMAALLGASAGHLVFGSLLETYIFLAALALAFMVFLIKDRPFFILVLTGLASFGVTILNFMHMVVAFIFVKRDFKDWIKYGMIVGVLAILLTLLNNVIYPDSQPYFFVPSSLNAEAENTFAPSVNRALAIGRVMALHSIVAPQPLILEEEIPFLKVWMFKADPMRSAEYESGFGKFLAVFWLGLCLSAGFLFLRNLRAQDQRFSLALLAILFFNFLLHLRYGKDLFLYSTNWIYALILFLSIQWQGISAQRWFQIILLVFIFLLLWNNSHLIHGMLATSALHIK